MPPIAARRSSPHCERHPAKGDKALVSNTGYRRYLKPVRENHFAIDPDKVEEDKKFADTFVLPPT